MPNATGPWGRPPAPQSGRGLVWIAIVLAATLLVWELFRLFPGALHGDMAVAGFIQTLGFLALLSAGVIVGRRFTARAALRNVGIWVAVAAVLMLGYTYRDSLEDAGSRLRAELVPGYAISTAPHTLTLTASDDGGFHIMGTVNGAPVDFLVDTGASDIVLSPADAARAGIPIAGLDYARRYETAHGEGRGATITVPTLTVGPLHFTNVEVSVDQSAMTSSLLGMAFLRRLDSFAVERHRLVLRWHG